MSYLSGDSEDLIFVNGIEFVGHHGILPEEKRHGGKYRVDLVIAFPMEEAARTDKIADTIDYRRLCQLIIRIGTGTRCNLVEKLAVTMANRILEESMAVACEVILHKYPYDMRAESVAVRVVRRRQLGQQ